MSPCCFEKDEEDEEDESQKDEEDDSPKEEENRTRKKTRKKKEKEKTERDDLPNKGYRCPSAEDGKHCMKPQLLHGKVRTDCSSGLNAKLQAEYAASLDAEANAGKEMGAKQAAKTRVGADTSLDLNNSEKREMEGATCLVLYCEYCFKTKRIEMS